MPLAAWDCVLWPVSMLAPGGSDPSGFSSEGLWESHVAAQRAGEAGLHGSVPQGSFLPGLGFTKELAPPPPSGPLKGLPGDFSSC